MNKSRIKEKVNIGKIYIAAKSQSFNVPRSTFHIPHSTFLIHFNSFSSCPVSFSSVRFDT